MSERSYVIYGPTAWDGHRNAAHNYARALATRHRVLYVEPPLSPLGPFRYGLGPGTWPGLVAVARRRPRTREGLEVFAPLALPPVENPRMRARSLPLVRAQLAGAVARAELRRPVVVGWRGLAELAGVAGERLRVAVIMDHPAAGAALLDRDPADLEDRALSLCRSADLICATSHAVRDLLADRGWPSALLPFGFPGDLAAAFDSAPAPGEYDRLPRPLLGYTGSVDDRLDFGLVTRVADRFRGGSIVFVGATSPRLSASARDALASRPNIHLLGARGRSELPGYIRHLDVALMPYGDDLFTRHQSPMKTWEYLYAGPPIVGTASPELRHYPPPLVNYADDADRFIRLVEHALAHPADGREQRRRFALANTWEARAAALDELVDRALADSPAERGAA